PLPRPADGRGDGPGRPHRTPGRHFRRHRAPVPPVQHPLPTARLAGAHPRTARPRGPAPTDAGLPPLVPLRLDGRPVHPRHHYSTLHPDDPYLGARPAPPLRVTQPPAR